MQAKISSKSVRYPTGRLNLIQSMLLLALFGVALTVVLRIFYA